MPFGPVVSGTRLAENEVVWPENLTIRTGPQAVHGPGLQIHENGAGYKSATTGFIVIHIDPLQLKLRIPLVPSRGIDPVLGTDHFPELGTDLVATLASLDVKDFSHFCRALGFAERERGERKSKVKIKRKYGD
jgi:hypothetical protein